MIYNDDDNHHYDGGHKTHLGQDGYNHNNGMVTKQIFGDEEGFIFLTGRLVNEQKCLCRARRRRRGGGRDTILLLPKTQVFSRVM